MKQHRGLLAIIIILLVILADQSLKFWIKTHFYIGEDLEILPWFHLLFVENNGMAFGMEVGSKLFLSVFRVVAMVAGIWYLWKITRRYRFVTGFVVCIALIVAGTAGNIIDCLFYGMIFNDPYPPEIAQFLPADGGYATFLHGKVVDMLYFPLVSFTWPDWMPWVGGDNFLFFQPVFNIADAAISVGIIAILLFYSRFFGEPISDPEPLPTDDSGSSADNDSNPSSTATEDDEK